MKLTLNVDYGAGAIGFDHVLELERRATTLIVRYADRGHTYCMALQLDRIGLMRLELVR